MFTRDANSELWIIPMLIVLSLKCDYLTTQAENKRLVIPHATEQTIAPYLL